MDDWDLQAIVKGCSKGTSSLIEDCQPPFYSLLSAADDDLSCIFPDFFGTIGSSLHEFEGLQNPVYPVFHQLIPHPSSHSSISDLLREFQEPDHHQKLQYQKKHKTTATKQKPSKKNRQNRVVKHVRADGVCSDLWAWRKYGQKPIKGSSYPRSYYRCSSSKGCPARKQVERSHSDPEMFVVTYTAEHNHAEPTRRNALAGSTRKKFPTTPENTEDIIVNGSSNLDMVLSPTSASTASMEEEQLVEGVADGEVLISMPFEISSDDIFSGLEELLYG